MDLLPAALASDEPQIAVRDGDVLAGRRVTDEPAGDEKMDFNGTVLLTGGTGLLGGLVARRLVTRHGVRRRYAWSAAAARTRPARPSWSRS